LQSYRTGFKPSRQLETSYAAAGVNVFAADTDSAARRLFTSAQQQFTNLVRGRPGKLQPPIEDIDAYWNPAEKEHAASMLTYSFVGSPKTVLTGLKDFISNTGVDELFVVTAMHDHSARLRSYEILADMSGDLT
jgi:alkanesulfonate monooxygenase SsuD/methylene tetrahydromethanopterin reductase-like flavin-dependent oxidoreductase (luciferase family)